MSCNHIFHTFESKQELNTELIEQIKDIITTAIQSRGLAFIALSGGNTPKELYRQLSYLDILWEKVFITLVDERWVEPEHQDSNEYLIRNFLMQNNAQQAKFIPLKNKNQLPQKGLLECEEAFCDFTQEFDMVILGMGEDAHTASFFPKATQLSEAFSSKKNCVAISPPDAPYERMSLTLARLLRSRNIFLHIEGEKKFKVFCEALNGTDIFTMPIRAFIHKEEQPCLEVYYAK